ncbi:MAG: ANTAR domain-containing response regulator [Solirubrobacterales bacterium]
MKKVLLATNNSVIKREVRDILVRCGFQICAEAANAADLLRKARSLAGDLVILDVQLDGGRIGQCAMVLEEDNIAPVLLLAGENDPLTREYAYVVRPFTEGSIIPAINSVILNHQKRQRLTKEVDRLRNQIATRKRVDIAKGLLMLKQGLNEEEAHKWMQRISMEKGIPLKTVAELIISDRG